MFSQDKTAAQPVDISVQEAMKNYKILRPVSTCRTSSIASKWAECVGFTTGVCDKAVVIAERKFVLIISVTCRCYTHLAVA